MEKSEKALVTFEDESGQKAMLLVSLNEDDSMNIKLDFGEGGAVNQSRLCTTLIKIMMKSLIQ